MSTSTERGFSLVEMLFALVILAVVAAGVLPLGLVAVKATENQGHLASRTTEYAQDKLEQLLALAYGDAVTDTRTFPATAAGGSGLTIGGSSNTDAPVDLYVDYLDVNGNLFPADDDEPANWYYMRAWQVTAPAGSANLKQITVTTTVRAAASGGIGRVPRSTVSALKTFPF